MSILTQKDVKKKKKKAMYIQWSIREALKRRNVGQGSGTCL
jgi:hypothetical protein